MNIQTDIFDRYFKHSPTELPTELICRHLAVAATSTDEYTDGYIRSVFHTLTNRLTDDYFQSVNHNITDGIQLRRYISSRNLFFGAQIPSVKPSANDFFVFPTDITTEEGITDRRNPSVMTSVKKYRRTSNHTPTELFRR